MKKLVVVLFAMLINRCFAQPQDSIESMTLFKDAGGKAGAEVAHFELQDRKQHFVIKLKKFEWGKNTFDLHFIGVETTQGNNIDIKRVTDVGNSLAANSITANLSLPNDWPLGRYAVEVMMNGKSLGRRPYVVSPLWSQQKIVSWALNGDDGKGRALETVLPYFKSTQRSLHIQAQTNGYVPRGTVLQWTLKTKAGQPVATVIDAIAPSSPVFNRLTFDTSLPRDWPVGVYVVQVHDGQRSVGQREFEIK
jgi:hypothetical protein